MGTIHEFRHEARSPNHRYYSVVSLCRGGEISRGPSCAHWLDHWWPVLDHRVPSTRDDVLPFPNCPRLRTIAVRTLPPSALPRMGQEIPSFPPFIIDKL